MDAPTIFSLTLDIKTIAIIVLTSILIGVLLAMRSYRPGSGVYQEKQKSISGKGLFIVIIVSIVLYPYFSKQPRTASDLEATPLLQNSSDSLSIIYESSKLDSTYSNDSISPDGISSPYNNIETSSGEYAIQIAAFTQADAAKGVIEQVSFEHTIKLIKEGNLYKIIIVGFPTYNAAKEYQNGKELQGFVRVYI